MAKATETNHPAQESFRKLQRQEIKGQVYEALSKDKELIEKDPFLARQEDYQLKFDAALGVIQKTYKDLQKYSPHEEASEERMVLSLQNYHSELGSDHAKITESVNSLKQAIEDFNSSQKVLQEMDIRKQEIEREVDQHVDNINAHRTKAKMEEYRPEREKSEVRPIRKIEDHLRQK